MQHALNCIRYAAALLCGTAIVMSTAGTNEGTGEKASRMRTLVARRRATAFLKPSCPDVYHLLLIQRGQVHCPKHTKKTMLGSVLCSVVFRLAGKPSCTSSGQLRCKLWASCLPWRRCSAFCIGEPFSTGPEETEMLLLMAGNSIDTKALIYDAKAIAAREDEHRCACMATDSTLWACQ